LSLGMNSPIGTEPWWNAEWRARFAKRAPHRKMRLVPTRVVRRSASFFLLSYIVAQSTDRETTGHHRRHSLAKIGAESERFVVLLLRVTMTRVRIASRERKNMRVENIGR
jgi:hypothetical protein